MINKKIENYKNNKGKMEVFNKLNTQMTITSKPKFSLGDNVFIKNFKKDKILFGVVIGINLNIDYKRSIDYDENEEQIESREPKWKYKILLRNGLIYYRGNDKSKKYLSKNTKKYIKEYFEKEIEHLSNLDEYLFNLK